MIDAGTAILIPALPLGIAAGLGWIRCARMLATSDRKLKIARDSAAHWQAEAQIHKADAWFHKCGATMARNRTTDLEDRLRKIEQSRHNAAKVGRAAQLAQQSAAKEARRLELERNVADRARVKIRRAA